MRTYIVSVGVLASLTACFTHAMESQLDLEAKAGPVAGADDAVCRNLGVFVRVPRGPRPEGGWPVVVGIHGGGWADHAPADPSRDYRNPVGYAKALDPLWQSEGIAVAVMSYRLAATGTTSWPGNLDDLRAGLSCLEEYHGSYGIDPTRMFALGESAGGHLALLLATYPGKAPKLKGAVAFFPPSDLTAFYESSMPGTAFRRARLEAMFGGTPKDMAAAYREASPLSHVGPATPAVMLLHGAKDELVDVAQTHAFAERLHAAGVPYEVIVAASGEHAYHGPKLLIGRCSMTATISSFIKGRALRNATLKLLRC